MFPEANGQQKTAAKRMTSQKMQPCQKILTLPAATAVMGAFIYDVFKQWGRECVSTGAAGAQTRRFLGHHLLHPLILRLLVLCAPAVLRPRALQDAPAPADLNS